MPKNIKFSDVTFTDLKQHVQLIEQNITGYSWDDVTAISLNEKELWSIDEVVNHIRELPVHLLNEATIWARAIYPLLMMAETGAIRAWAGVSLSCQYKQFSLDGVADGVLGKTYVGRMDAPYLVVVEAKRGIESQSPVAQSYAQMLAAARLNWEQDLVLPQEVFGCYTIADVWTFVRAVVTDIDTDRPTMNLEISREYVTKLEACTIVRILKKIVAAKIGFVTTYPTPTLPLTGEGCRES